MEYTVNDSNLNYNAKGEKTYGSDVILLDHAVDITANTTWGKEGYTVSELFPADLYSAFIRETKKLLVDLWRKAGIDVHTGFSLDQYHHVASTKEIHLAAVEQTKLIHTTAFPITIAILEETISKLCNQQLVAKNPFDGQSIFHFRVVRPNSGDNNPLHRDVWLEDYKGCINLYIPVVGSNENSSLILVPGSHRWPESKIERTLSGAEINGVKFNVPAVTRISGEVNFIRPNPKENEVLLFSPYLVHGGSTNLNTNSTRISIEIRLWKK